MRVPRPFLALFVRTVWIVAGSGLVCSAYAQSDEGDLVRLQASQVLLHDSNFLRASDQVTAFPLGRPDASETLSVTTVGLKLDQTVSRQRFELDLSLANQSHQHFKFLDYTAHNHRAAWRWQLGADLQGSLSHERKQTLNSFTDTTNYSQRNLLTQLNTRANASYRLSDDWRLLAEAGRTRETRTITSLQEGETQTNSAGAGLQYVWPSGSSLSAVHRTVRGTFLGRTLSLPGLLDTGYRQSEHNLKLQWPISGKTALSAEWTALSREHPHFPVRDFSGHNASLMLSWQPTGAWLWQARWQQELANYQTLGSNYSVTQRWSIGPVWQITDKTRLLANAQASRETYEGNPGLPATLARTDTLRDFVLSAEWQLHQKVSLAASLSQGRRNSTQYGYDYDYRSASLLLDVAY